MLLYFESYGKSEHCEHYLHHGWEFMAHRGSAVDFGYAKDNAERPARVRRSWGGNIRVEDT